MWCVDLPKPRIHLSTTQPILVIASSCVRFIMHLVGWIAMQKMADRSRPSSSPLLLSTSRLLESHKLRHYSWTSTEDPPSYRANSPAWDDTSLFCVLVDDMEIQEEAINFPSENACNLDDVRAVFRVEYRGAETQIKALNFATWYYVGNDPYTVSGLAGHCLEIGSRRVSCGPVLARPWREIYICGVFHIPQRFCTTSAWTSWTSKWSRQQQFHDLQAHLQYGGESQIEENQLLPLSSQKLWKEHCFAPSTRLSIGSTTTNTFWPITAESRIPTWNHWNHCFIFTTKPEIFIPTLLVSSFLYPGPFRHSMIF